MKKNISEELLDYKDFEKRKDGRFYIKAVFLVILVIMFGIYIGNMLFGDNSLEMLLNLQNTEKRLEKRTKDLKKENAKLQKKYFELKQLEGE